MPMSEGGQRHVFGLHSHPSDWNFKLDWFGWTNGTTVLLQASRFGALGHVTCWVDPKWSLEGVIFLSKIPMSDWDSEAYIWPPQSPKEQDLASEWFGWIIETEGDMLDTSPWYRGACYVPLESQTVDGGGHFWA